MSNIGSDFYRHLIRRKKERLKKNDIVTSKYQSNATHNLSFKDSLVSKVDIEKENNNYILKGKKVDKIEESPISIVKENNLLKISKKDDVILKTKIQKSILEELEESIKNNKKFDIKLEDINEKNIKNELNKIIEKDKKEVLSINEEILKIDKKANIYQKSEYIDELKIKLENVKKRLSEIRKHYEIISDYYDFKGYSNLNNTLLINSIEDYSFYKNVDEIDELVMNCKKESEKLSVIIDVTDKCIKEDKKILEVKRYTQKRDEDFLLQKEKISLIDDGYEKIDKNIKYQEDFLKNLNKDISYLEDELSNFRLFDASKSLFDNMFRIGLSTNLMPLFPSFRLLFQVIILKSATDGIRNFFNPEFKKEIITKRVIRDYINMIYENKNNIDLTTRNLDGSISNIVEIRKEYISKFGKFSDVLDDYDVYLKKMDLTINKLNDKKEELVKIKKELNNKEQKVLELKK